MIAPALLAAAVVLSAAGLATRSRPLRRSPVETVGGAAAPRAATPTGSQWATVLEHMASEVRTGASIAAAHLAATGIPLSIAGGHTAAVADAIDTVGTINTTNSTDTTDTINTTDTSAVDDDEALAVQAIAAARVVGGPVAATLDAAADTIRERARLRHEARAHSAPARLSATVLTAVPVIFCMWNLLTSASFRAAFTSTAGLAAASLGALCNMAGWWSMRRLIAKALP